MGNCLVTKLKSVVNNDDLGYLNEICLDVTPSSGVTVESFSATISHALYEAGVRQRFFITGAADCYFTSPDGTQNYGRELIGDSEWTDIYIHVGTTMAKVHIENAYSQLLSLRSRDWPTYLHLGDSSKIRYCSALNIYHLYGNQGMVGDFFEYFPQPDIIAVNPIYDLSSHFTGDLSLAPSSLRLLDAGGLADAPYHQFTWKNVRPSSAYIIEMEGCAFGDDLDAMLINQAECVPSGQDIVPYHEIAVRGNRTSASDAAVATLKSKGMAVRVNGELL